MSPVPPPPDTAAQPVASTDRIVLLDVLRGFALAGVFVSNVFVWFTGMVFVTREQAQAALAAAPWWDTVASQLYSALVSGRFISLFSFLFGLGFSVQLLRAQARGTSINRLYARRLGVMLLIGGVHLTALWYGDILTTYATVGFLLLLFQGLSDRALLRWALVLIFVVPLVIASAMRWLPPLFSGTPGGASEAARASLAQSEAVRLELGRVFKTGGYLEVVRANASFFFGEFIRRIPPMLSALFGRFLLGFLAGRLRLFHDADQHLPFFRKLLRWSLGLGGAASVAILVVNHLVRQKVLLPHGAFQLFLMPVRQLAELGMAAAYASALVLLLQRETWARALRVLAPVGRMALTNYLCQSVLSIVIYYGLGLGLMGQVKPAACIALTLGLFSLQIGFSHWWLARFRFGPAEWLWRSLTYGKAQPMRRESVLGAAAH
ncbi:DUF418 domain-containing protein [Archangium primigenium]|uniref:DUF418 domain-containing protein n=1 Tax=[Archangium] primigenium TaxID=2792470 RepID=UPI00195BC794|nr:DUF418 domain-containing protein [Archangium primigenium]MBM7119061.1 DUF418 domain-containing protein [Archangium primigenium]